MDTFSKALPTWLPALVTVRQLLKLLVLLEVSIMLEKGGCLSDRVRVQVRERDGRRV